MGNLSDDTLGKFINRAQAQCCESYDWSFLHTNYVVNSVAPKSDGTISLTQGNATVFGAGTNFTPADIGAFLWVGGLNIAPVPIADVQGPAICTLGFPWSGPTQVGISYVIAPLYYLIEGGLEVFAVRQIEFLEKVTRETLNIWDPARIGQGGAPALNWANAPASPDGSVQIELYPVCTDTRPYLIEYKMKPPLLVNDNDVPLIPYEIIEEKAAAAACRALYASTGQASWQALAQFHQGLYTEAFESGWNADRRRQQHSNMVTQPAYRPSWVDEYIESISDRATG